MQNFNSDKLMLENKINELIYDFEKSHNIKIDDIVFGRISTASIDIEHDEYEFIDKPCVLLRTDDDKIPNIY